MATITYSALNQLLQTSSIPSRMREHVVAYVMDGHIPCRFVSAVLSNDLKEACITADEDNRYRIYDYVFFLYNYAPSDCFGSKDKFEKWLAQGGFNRKSERKIDGV